MRENGIWSYTDAAQILSIASVTSNQHTATKIYIPIEQILLNAFALS